MANAALFDLSGAGWIAVRNKNFYIELDGVAFQCRVAHFGIANSHRVFGSTPETSPVTVILGRIVVVIPSPELADGHHHFARMWGFPAVRQSPIYDFSGILGPMPREKSYPFHSFGWRPLAVASFLAVAL